MHPSSGHEKRRALEVSVSVSSLEFSLELSSSLSCFGTVSLRLDFTGANLAMTPSLFTSVKYGTSEFSVQLIPRSVFPSANSVCSPNSQSDVSMLFPEFR